MDLHTETYTFQKLLLAKKTYIVPRYQREFSWGKQEINELYYDIFKRLIFDEETNSLKNSEYFFGNILLQGDMVGSNKEMYIIDGQQRLTAITIFLSTIATMFASEGEEDLRNAVWQYVVSKDDNGKQIAILKNSTPYPYFQYKIQSIGIETTPSSEEEDRIEAASNFFKKKLNKKSLLKEFKLFYKTDYGYIDILKALRDQVLNSYFICSWTSDTKYANLVFEIMNAKGKELETIDLVKNLLFEHLDNEDPADFAREEWKNIHENLLVNNGSVPLSTFFRHFWYSLYGYGNSAKIWRESKRMLNSKEKCTNFILRMERYSRSYKRIINPSLKDYNNRKELSYIVSALNIISNELCVDMPRVILLSAMEKFNSGLLTTNMFGGLIKFIERFHFVYNGIFSLRTNKLTSFYCEESKALSEATTKQECSEVIDEFKTKLKSALPSEAEFLMKVNELTYVKNEHSQKNVLSKILLNEIENIVSGRKNNKEYSSIEHLLNENPKDMRTRRIARLMILEQDINNSIPSIPLIDKLEYYKQSNYAVPKKLVSLLSNVSEDKYDEILDNFFKENATLFYRSIN